ncbi:PEP-CTERM sorting domain-containing protein [Geobacter grbiciae]|uniref:PEP-CTERM sorting domain-containing protein n=1 Tax=Geobacter grbiciae TaxID=155042 RepID=UPI001C01633F|nr:PEP-CTERM sorting domain-containing protein [Geobacter grbiciae]MBT1074690.1 PEP-CTERM sorting domain-containing protein [Geobacter grbiciae]
MKTVKKMTITAALFATCAAGNAFAATTTIDFAGVGQPVAQLDWSVGNALGVNAVPLAITDGTGNPATDPAVNPALQTHFNLYYQAILGNYNNATNKPILGSGLNSTYEITAMIAFGERGYTSALAGPVPANASFFFDPTLPNYVKFYKSAINASDLAGTGFNDGNEFLSGRVVSVTRSNFSTEANTGLLDQNLADDWAGQQTIYGTGSTAVTIAVDQINKDEVVITNPLNLDFIIMSLNFNTSNNLPFLQADPSRLFWDVSAGANVVPALGAVNGINGPDIIFQADGNNSFQIAAVPEPSTFALTGLGLLLAGGFMRRRAKK